MITAGHHSLPLLPWGASAGGIDALRIATPTARPTPLPTPPPLEIVDKMLAALWQHAAHVLHQQRMPPCFTPGLDLCCGRVW